FFKDLFYKFPTSIFLLFIELGSQRYMTLSIVTSRAGRTLMPSNLPIFSFNTVNVSQVSKGMEISFPYHNHVSATSSIATIWASTWHVFFTTKEGGTIATLTGSHH